MNDVSPKQQAVELITEAKNILVVSHRNPDGDAVGSLVALKIVLEKLDKKVQIVCPETPAKSFTFLPRVSEIETELDISRDFIITLDTTRTKVDNLGYKRDEAKNVVDIVITPKGGKFDESDVTFRQTGPKFDLIIAVDTPNLERLGNLAEPADLFYEIPLVNIDHHPSNEKFGKVNWIELVATSTTEILVSLLEALGKDQQLIDADVATALLTGLIYDTSSFQNVNTTPKSLTVAAQLVAAGARQQEIIRNLYKTKSLETLKLWGAILSNVKEDKIHRFLWSSITREEIERIGADQSALSGVIDELLKSATDVDFALLLAERPDGQVSGSLRSIAKGYNVSQIAELFSGGGHEVAAAFRIDGTIKSKEDDILAKIRHFQEKSAGFSPEPFVAPVKVEEKNSKPEEKIEEKPAEALEKPLQEEISDKIESDDKNVEAKPDIAEPDFTTAVQNEIEEPVEEETPPANDLNDLIFGAPLPSETVETKDEPTEKLERSEDLPKTKW